MAAMMAVPRSRYAKPMLVEFLEGRKRGKWKPENGGKDGEEADVGSSTDIAVTKKRMKLPQLYLATCGRGTSVVVAAEIKEKIGVNAETNDGRVFFETNINPSTLSSLRTVERIICVVIRKSGIIDGGCQDLANVLKERGKKPWQRAYKCLCASDESLSKEKVTFPEFIVNAKTSYGYAQAGVESWPTGEAITKVVEEFLKWHPAKSRNFDGFHGVEVYFHANDRELISGLPLFRTGGGLLAMRGRNLMYPGLRPTTANVVGRLASIEDGDVVVDLAMGHGVLLIEAALEHRKAKFRGGDKDPKAVSSAKMNIQMQGLSSLIKTQNWDINQGLPILDNSIDKVISDLPYGRKHGSAESNKELYPNMLRECERILKVNGVASLLTTEVGLLLSLLESRSDSEGKKIWRVDRRLPLKLGNILADVFVLVKVREDLKGRETNKKARQEEMEIQRQDAREEAQQMLKETGFRLLPRALMMARSSAQKLNRDEGVDIGRKKMKSGTKKKKLAKKKTKGKKTTQKKLKEKKLKEKKPKKNTKCKEKIPKIESKVKKRNAEEKKLTNKKGNSEKKQKIRKKKCKEEKSISKKLIKEISLPTVSETSTKIVMKKKEKVVKRKKKSGTKSKNMIANGMKKTSNSKSHENKSAVTSRKEKNTEKERSKKKKRKRKKSEIVDSVDPATRKPSSTVGRRKKKMKI